MNSNTTHGMTPPDAGKMASTGLVRVRFAPSPTGFLHVGGARTALFNWLFARHHGGVFVLRIEDTDRERSRWDAVEKILDSMAWLGMAWDEGPLVGGPHGPYFQSERRGSYIALADRLLAEGHAYRCYCTPEELQAEREAAQRSGHAFRYPGRCRDLRDADRARLESEGRRPALRFVLPSGATRVDDMLHGDVTVDHAELDDFVILKSDGFPAYNFAVVADDSAMRITHVIRGDDHISNTPRQVLLYRALGLEPPRFLHVPQILGPDKARLSKRHGATSVSEYREQGFLPEAMMCYLARLGWSYDDKRELFPVDELVELFDVKRIGKTPSVFDVEKLAWVNSRFHRALGSRERAAALLPWLVEAKLAAQRPSEDEMDRIAAIIEALGDRVRPGRDFVEQARPFLGEPPPYDEVTWEKVLRPEPVAGRLAELADRLERVERYELEEVEAVVRGLAEDLGIKAKEIIHPVRFAVTAQTIGAGLFDALVLVGRAETVARLRRVVSELRTPPA